jgi:acyl carrier protein
MNTKKKLKKIVEETFSWVNDPKGSDDFHDDLNISYEELGNLKEPIQEAFDIKIRRKEIKECYDINGLTKVVESKMGYGEYLSIPSSGNLWEDLERYNDELEQADVIAGLKIIGKIGGEIGGGISLGMLTAFLLSHASGVLAPIGIVLGPGIIARYITMAVNAYTNMNEEERRKVRNAIKWINFVKHKLGIS